MNATNEASLMRKVSHKYIVKYIDSFLLGEKFYIVIEHCDKGDLGNYLARLGSSIDMPEWRIWKILI
jgi:serine/threonine protein kinase